MKSKNQIKEDLTRKGRTKQKGRRLKPLDNSESINSQYVSGMAENDSRKISLYHRSQNPVRLEWKKKEIGDVKKPEDRIKSYICTDILEINTTGKRKKSKNYVKL